MVLALSWRLTPSLLFLPVIKAAGFQSLDCGCNITMSSTARASESSDYYASMPEVKMIYDQPTDVPSYIPSKINNRHDHCSPRLKTILVMVFVLP